MTLIVRLHIRLHIQEQRHNMNKMEYKPIEEEDVWPICPHCSKAIQLIRYFEQTGVVRMKVVRVFVCPHCRKVLGTGMVGM